MKSYLFNELISLSKSSPDKPAFSRSLISFFALGFFSANSNLKLGIISLICSIFRGSFLALLPKLIFQEIFVIQVILLYYAKPFDKVYEESNNFRKDKHEANQKSKF